MKAKFDLSSSDVTVELTDDDFILLTDDWGEIILSREDLKLIGDWLTKQSTPV